MVRICMLLVAASCSGASSGGGTSPRSSGAPAQSPPEVEEAPQPALPDVAVGARHSCVTRSGTVWCWGADDVGQLGDGSMSDTRRPLEVPGLSGIAQIEAAGNTTCARSVGGDVWCWGDMSAQPDDPRWRWLRPSRVSGLAAPVTIAVGPTHACALAATGRVQCWGSNRLGQLGDGTRDDSLAPVHVATRERFVDIEVGDTGSCGETEDGRWLCWGRRPDEYNLLHSPSAGSDSLHPVEVPPVAGSTLALGRSVCAARGQSVRCAGGLHLDDVGRLRALVTGGPYGGVSVCALRDDGEVWCAGRNDDGQTGTFRPAVLETAVRLPGLSNTVALALGPRHGCAAAADGSVECWGDNTSGQRGTGSIGEIVVRPSPVRFGDEPMDPAESACVPSHPHVCMLAEDGNRTRVCYCSFDRTYTEPTRCWRMDPASGEVQPTAAPAEPPEEPVPGPPASLRSTASRVSVCDDGGRCHAVRPRAPQDLLRADESGGILAGVSGDGTHVSVGRIDRAHVEEVDEVGPVAPILVETYEVASGRRIAQFRLPFPLPTDLWSESPLSYSGSILEVWYSGVVGGVELWDPRRGVRLHERDLLYHPVHAAGDIWVYLGELGETLWIRENGAIVHQTAALPLTESSEVLEPAARGLHSGDRVIVATAARLRVFDDASGALQQDIALPWCRPGNAR